MYIIYFEIRMNGGLHSICHLAGRAWHMRSWAPLLGASLTALRCTCRLVPACTSVYFCCLAMLFKPMATVT
jgi:hypothetical protein